MKNKILIYVLIAVFVLLVVAIAVYFTLMQKGYSVVFLGMNGKEISVQKVKKGEDAIQPKVDNFEDMVFLHWDKDYKNITENIKINAVYGQVVDIENKNNSWRFLEYFDINRNIANEYAVSYSGEAVSFLTFPNLRQGEKVSIIGSFVRYEEFETRINKGKNVLQNSLNKQTLTKVNIPYGILEIYDYAFYDTKSLEEVVIPETVEIIGRSAFAMTSITRIELPSKLEKIGVNFLGAEAKKIEIVFRDNGEERLAENFITDGVCIYSKDGKKLITCYDKTVKDYTVRQGTEEICELAFANSLLEKIDISGVNKISSQAFQDCKSLENVLNADSVKSIGELAFGGCYELKQCTVINVEEILDKAFFKTGLQRVFLPNSLVEVGSQAFAPIYNTAPATFYVENGQVGENWAEDWNDSQGAVRLNSTIDEFISGINFMVEFYLVTDDNNMIKCQSYSKEYEYGKEVSIPSNSQISSYLSNQYVVSFWYYMDGENQVIIPNDYSIVVTKDCVFYAKTFKIDNVFLYTLNSDGKSYTISKGDDFQLKYTNKTIIIPDIYMDKEITSIGVGAFTGITGYDKIVLGENIQSIGDGAFLNCHLKEVDFSKATELKDMGASCFWGNDFSTVTIPDSVNNMKVSVFQDNKNLESVIIGSGMTKIANSTFFDCSKLKNIQINGNITKVEAYAFYECSNLSIVGNLFKNLSVVGEQSFYGCSSLEIEITSNMTKIGSKAFWDCQLGILIELNSSTLTEVGSEVFNSKLIVIKVDFSQQNTPLRWASNWYGNAIVDYKANTQEF